MDIKKRNPASLVPKQGAITTNFTGEVMKNPYIKTVPAVKTGYTIRLHGRVWHVRMAHLEIIGFLRRLCAARRAA